MSHLVNFCLGPFIKCAETSSVCADGCSVGNLVSMDSSARRRGFQVEHFIRPPVHVEFQFTVPVHVGCILLDPLLSPGTEAKIEVSGSLGGKCHYFKHFGTAVVKDHSLLVLRNKEFERHFGEFPPGMAVLGSHVSLVDRGLTFQSLKHSNALTMLQCLRVSFTRFTGVKPVALKSMELWGHSSPACSAKDRQTLESIFIGLQEHPPFASPFNCLGVYKSSQEQPLASHRSNESQHEIPSACDSLQPAGVIPAGSTEDGLPSAGLEQSMTVCLGMEEIKHMQGLGMEPLGVQRQLEGRGNPPTVSHGLCHRVPEGETDTLEATSSSCSVDLQETLLKNKTPSTTGQVWLPSRQQSHAHSNSSIPESFLDEITYEVMVIPMLLPSGHYVDRTTLERVRDTDAAYGRGECDPFTGRIGMINRLINQLRTNSKSPAALVLNPLDDILATLVEDALCTEEMSQGAWCSFCSCKVPYT